MITIGSLFSGVGGLDLGLEAGLSRTGHQARTIWQVEQNDYARAVLARHWPHARRHTDVRTITHQTVHAVDLLCGGFPCQDLSYAGKGAGLAGERSGLFFEMARIVRELRPRVVVLENVPAIATRGLDVVLGTLAALGYDARWGGLRASEVGAPHRRERWFCVAWLADTPVLYSDASGDHSVKGSRPVPKSSRDGAPGMADSKQDGCFRDASVRDSGALDCAVHQTCKEGATQAISADSGRQSRPLRVTDAISHEARTDTDRIGGSSIPGVDGAADGLPCRLDLHRWPAPPGPQYAHEPPRTRPRQPHDRERLKGLGNAVVPQCGMVIGRWIGENLLAGFKKWGTTKPKAGEWGSRSGRKSAGLPGNPKRRWMLKL